MATVKTQAHCLLAGSTALCVFSYPFTQGNVAIDFLHHVALAGTIGGLADWWGVTAIFKRPLGINAPGSDVLRKNYDRLTGALADFVCDDLLAATNVMQALQPVNFGRLLVEHFRSENNMQRLWDALQPLTQHVLASLNTERAEQLLAKELPKYIASLKVPQLIIDTLQRAVAQDSFKGLWQLLAQEGRALLAKQEFNSLLTGIAQLAEEEYISDSTLRQFFVSGKAEQLVPVFRQQLVLALADLANAHSSLRCTLDNWLLTKLESYRGDIAFTEWVNSKLTELALQYAKGAKAKFLQQDADMLFVLLEEKFAALANSEVEQREVDAYIKRMLTLLLEQNHAVIHQMVSDKLAAYDRDELIASMEQRVGDDLQNIRKSGTYLGAMMGGLLFIIELLAERLVG